jgi:hypothetical protein
MSGAEMANLRPRVEELREISTGLAEQTTAMERRLEEAIKNVDKSAVQLRGYAVTVGELNHQLNSLKGAIALMLDELDTLAPMPAPANSNAAPKKGGNG